MSLDFERMEELKEELLEFDSEDLEEIRDFIISLLSPMEGDEEKTGENDE